MYKGKPLYSLDISLFSSRLTFKISSVSGHISCRLEELQPLPSRHSLLHQRLFLRGQYRLAGPVPGWSTRRDCVQERQHHAAWGALVSECLMNELHRSLVISPPVFMVESSQNRKCDQKKALKTTFMLLCPLQVFRDSVMRHHLHHRVLLPDVGCDLVRHADLCLAHVLQSPGHHPPAAVWQNFLLPHGDLVHPLRPHCGHPGYR